jgi:signal peptidase I
MHRTARTVRWAVAIVLAAIVWSQLAPPSLGGRTTFLVVQGTSMLPRFRAGDLVAVRVASAYPVGTIAAYHYVPYHAIFFHRIIAQHDGHYTFQGINNPTPDPYHPSAAQIVGEYWFALPHVGAWLAFWRTPFHAAVLVGAVAGVSVLTIPGRRRRQLGRSEQVRTPQATPISWGRAGAAVLILTGLAAGAFSTWAFFKPLHTTRTQILRYTQAGRFAYHGQVPKTIVYPDGQVQSGVPLFSTLVPAMNVSFDYRATMPRGRVLGGTVGMEADLVSTNGWHQPLAVKAPVAFRGSTVHVGETINIAQVFGTVATIEKLTHDTLDSYRLVLRSRVQAEAVGTGGRLVRLAFSPSMSFAVQPSWLQLSVPTTSTLASYLNPVDKGTVPILENVSATLTVMGRSLPVAEARMFGLATAAAAGLGALALTVRIRRRDRKLGEAGRIARQYGSLLVDVEALPFSPAERSIRVGSMAGLVRLAEQCDRMILHAHRGGEHVYLLENVGESYYFTAADDPREEPPPKVRPTILGPESAVSP